jgi:hypothetical protein
MSFDIGKFGNVRIPGTSQFCKKKCLIKELKHFYLSFKFMQLGVIDGMFLTELFCAPFISAQG